MVAAALLFLVFSPLSIKSVTRPVSCRNEPQQSLKPGILQNESSPGNHDNPHEKRWEGTVSLRQDFILTAPQGGEVVSLAKAGDRVTAGVILAEIANEQSRKAAHEQQGALDREISMADQSIEIARQDITNLNREIDQLKDTVKDKEYSFADAEREYRQELMGEAAFIEKKDELDRLKRNLESRESMLRCKYENIASLQKEIIKLQSSAKQISQNLIIKAPCDGVVGEVLARVGEKVNEQAMLMKLTPCNVVSLKLQGESLLGLDGKKILLTMHNAPDKKFSGIMKIADFSFLPGQRGERADAEVILDQGQADLSRGFRGKVVVSLQGSGNL